MSETSAKPATIKLTQTIDEMFNRHDAASLAAAYAPEAKLTHPRAGFLEGRAAIQAFKEAIFTGYPNCSVQTLHLLSSEQVRLSAWIFKGTNTGVLPDGVTPPTNRSVTIHGMTMSQLGPDGLIVAEREYWDMHALRIELGLA
jgi:SnoaL-like domain